MRKIKDVLRLKLDARLSHERIAAALGISKGVVTKYVGLASVAGLDWHSIQPPRVRHQNADFAFLVKPLPCESTTYAHFCGSFVVATA